MSMDKVNMNDEDLGQVSGGTILPYRVQPGDSLKAIADRYHVSVDQLMKWNDLKDPNYLKAGSTLKIKF